MILVNSIILPFLKCLLVESDHLKRHISDLGKKKILSTHITKKALLPKRTKILSTHITKKALLPRIKKKEHPYTSTQ